MGGAREPGHNQNKSHRNSTGCKDLAVRTRWGSVDEAGCPMTTGSAVQNMAASVKMHLTKTLNPELELWATMKVLKVALKC